MTETAGTVARYTTIAGQYRHELEIRRSRFITVLQRVENEADVVDLMNGLRREFSDARHHCSAFILGPGRDLQRSNDDGEPSGTAGQPMLEALNRRVTPYGLTDLSDIAAVVVRYFGGVLLGAGGLVRAYSESVSRALDTARLVHRERRRLFVIPAPPATAGRLENELRGAGMNIAAVEYKGMSTRLTVAVQDEDAALDAFHGHLAGISAGELTAIPAGQEWVDRA
ncbi:YigZ family protein [Arthrobacter tumbae]|uniref:IMPACT family protein n=1 Tax=Arthrobacter tumbae TaxID=163874 RepID=UPI0027DDEE44|nr:YigZ family protein [Arthrobacter tumbae]MBM7783038.1 putative YigZ family protein [Arthrobacter tumbae]